MKKKCSVDSCDRPSRRHELCETHASRYLKHGDPQAHIPIIPKRRYDPVCSVDGCHNRHDELGFCTMHAQRFRKTGSPGQTGRLRVRNQGRLCSVDDCGYPASTLGYCQPHYRRFAKHGSPTGGSAYMFRHKPPQSDVSPDHKWCSRCRQILLKDDNFGFDKRTVDGIAHWCKRCYADARLIKTYKITLLQYEEMLESQGGGCLLCGTSCDPYERVSRLSVDHDHACCPGLKSCGNCVRGLVCSACNHVLGGVQDNVEVLARMIGYLNHHKERLELLNAGSDLSSEGIDRTA